VRKPNKRANEPCALRCALRGVHEGVWLSPSLFTCATVFFVQVVFFNTRLCWRTWGVD